MRLAYDKSTARKDEIAEEKKDLGENLKRLQKQSKKKKEVLQELQKLGGQDLRVL
jgi:hypothetical protein